MTNPVDLMDSTGYLVKLHGDTAIYKKGDEKVAIQGISGVPEIFAKDVFQKLNPKPREGCTNIFMLHQSVGNYVYTDEKSPGLRIEELPENFDLIIDGHIHWRAECRIGLKKETLFLLPGSTLTTQIRKNEAEKEKGVTIYNTETKKTEFIPLKSQRKVIYKEIELNTTTPKEIKLSIMQYLSTLEKEQFKKKPLVRIKTSGKLEGQGIKIDLNDIQKQYRDKFILSFKNSLKSKDKEKSIELVAQLIDNKVSIDNMGLAIMKDCAEKEKITFDYQKVFELLAEGNIEDAEKEILQKKEKKDVEKTA